MNKEDVVKGFSFIKQLNDVPSDRPALYCARRGGWLDYKTLIKAIDAVKNNLAQERRGLAFMLFSSCFDDVALYLGAVAAGHVPLLLDPKLDPSLLAPLVAHYRPDFILGSDAKSPGPDWRQIEGCAAFAKKDPDLLSFPEIHPDLALLLPTSGSTGSPKMARLTANAVDHNCQAIIHALAIRQTDRPLAHLPLHYSYGLSVLHSHLSVGASIILTEYSMMQPEFWDLARLEKCSSFSGTPFHYRMLDRLGLNELDAPDILVLTQAGGRLGAELVEKMHNLMTQRGGRFYVMYGQTEAAPRITTLDFADAPGHWASAGKALMDSQLLAVDSDHHVLPPGQPGEIVYIGPNVMMGYAHDRADLGLGDDVKGVLHTGDTGYLDNDGRLYLTGRASRMAKVAGLRLNLDEIEKLAESHGRIAAVECKDGVALFVEQLDNEARRALLDDLAKRLRIHAHFFFIHPIDAIPVTAKAKIDYAKLKTLAAR